MIECQIDVALADGSHPMPGQSHHPGHCGKGHLTAQCQDQCLEQQCEASKLPRPIRLDLADATLGQAHTRHPHFEVALVLEEVQVSVALAHRVMHRMRTLYTGDHEAATRDKVDRDRQHLPGGIEIDPAHMPRVRDTQCGLEQPPCVRIVVASIRS